jgi:carboxymethylenebutenolidase
MMIRQTIDVSGSTMSLLLASPEGDSGAHPGLVLCHHREGIDAFTRHAASYLADHGFVVAVPDFYHRRPAGESWALSRKAMQDVEVVADLTAVTKHLTTQPSVRPSHLGIIGHCMGGRTAFLGAATSTYFKSAVMLYGGHIFRTEGSGMPPPVEMAKNISCRILGLYGRDDHVIAPEEVARLSAELDRCGVDHSFHIYDGAGHAFQDFEREAVYRKSVSDDAWGRVIAFLTQTLSKYDPVA